MAVLDSITSKVTLYSRNMLVCYRQIRSCHITVQESTTKITKSKHSLPSMLTSERLMKPFHNRLGLTVQQGSALNAHPFGLVRPYSALPQRAIFTTPVWTHEESTSTSNIQRKCWNCGRETDLQKELFFCHCGVVQTPADDKVNFFSLLGIDEGFDVDVKKLGETYKNLQKHLHPDMFSLKSETEKSLAEQQSSLLNKAYFTLLKPLPRALYILELHGYVIEEETTAMDPEFLMEIMDLNECIGESSLDGIQDIEKSIEKKINGNIEQLAHAFAVKDYKTAQDIAVKLKYLVNVESKIKSFYSDRM